MRLSGARYIANRIHLTLIYFSVCPCALLAPSHPPGRTLGLLPHSGSHLRQALRLSAGRLALQNQSHRRGDRILQRDGLLDTRERAGDETELDAVSFRPLGRAEVASLILLAGSQVLGWLIRAHPTPHRPGKLCGRSPFSTIAHLSARFAENSGRRDLPRCSERAHTAARNRLAND